MAIITQMVSIMIPASSNPSTTAVRYADFRPSIFNNVFESTANQRLALNGTAKNVAITVANAPGVGKSYNFRYRKAGAYIGYDLFLSETKNRVSNPDSFSVSPGDNVTIEVTPSGTPAATGNLSLAWEFESAVDGESQYLSYSDDPSNTVTTYKPIFTDKTSGWSSTAANQECVCPIPCTITGAVFRLVAAPGAAASGKSFTFTIYKNGIKQDGTSGTVNTQVLIFETATSGSATFVLSALPGDRFYMECVPANTPTASAGVTFATYVTSTDKNSFIICFNDFGAASQSATRFHTTMNGWQDGFSGWASSVNSIASSTYGAAVTTYKLQGTYGQITAAPGTGRSRTLTLFKNGASIAGGPIVPFVGNTVTNNDPNGIALWLPTDVVGWENVPSNTPASSRISLAMGASKYVSGAQGSDVPFGIF